MTGSEAFGAGLDVVVLDGNTPTRNGYLALAVTRAFAQHPRVARARLAVYDDVIETCRQGAADLLLVMGGSDGFAPVIARAAALARRSVLWTGEDPYELPANVALSRLFDLSFTNDLGSIRAYPPSGAGPGARHLPFAASPELHAPDPDADTDPLYDLVFVGTAWPNRIAMLDALVARLPPGLRLKFGLSGNAFLPDRDLARPGLLTGFRVAPRDFARMASRARLVLTLDRDFSTARGGGARGTSPPPRLFEIGLSGTPQVYLSRTPPDPRYYAVGAEIAVVRDVDAAAAAIGALLDDDPRRRAMGAAARRRTLTHHLYAHRVDTILAALDAGAAHAHRPAAGWRPAPASRKPRVLLVAHNLSGVPPAGGVELYQDTLIAGLPEFDFVLLASSRRRIALTLVDPARRRIEAFPARFLEDGAAFEPQRERIFTEALVRHEIDLVHVQHLMHHSFAYPMLARMAGVPQVATAHDYYFACTRFNLIGPDRVFCGIATDRTAPCDTCLRRTGDLAPGAQARRREIMRVALRAFDRVLFNTPASRDLTRRIYPDLAEAACRVVGMTGEPATLNALAAGRPRSASPRDAAGRLRVFVLGNVSAPKGGAWIVEAMRALREAAIVFHVHGRVEVPYGAAVAGLPNVVLHGEYEGAELPARLGGAAGLSLHLSVWPETYCIALDEARAAGLVPIVLGYGALAERVRDGIDGFVVSPDRPDRVIDLLRRLAADPAPLTAMTAPPDSDGGANHEAHLAAIRAVYREVIARKPVVHGDVPAGHRRVPAYTDLARRFDAARWDTDVLDLDEVPGPPAPAAPPPVPNRPGWLRGLVARPKPGAQGHLDTFAGPHDPAVERRVTRAELGALRLGGWLVPRDRSGAYNAIEVRLEGAWSVRIATIITPRADVAATLAAPHLATCGFVSLAELGWAPEGGYTIALHGTRSDGRVDVVQAGRIHVT